jgi:hypothetical protein
MQEKVINKLFFAYIDSKTTRIRQTKPKPCKIGQIRQKSVRNWQSARNIFYPPDNFQIRQNFTNLAVKTAIWQRWSRLLKMADERPFLHTQLHSPLHSQARPAASQSAKTDGAAV